ncbi:MAG: hypothetical protein AMXMBFR46_23290 [Acidimicrobiia bacterium]
MRRRRRPTDSPPCSPPPGSPAVDARAGYDWTRFGRHHFRAPAGALIDLPVSAADAASVWVATIWPQPDVAGGWARTLWLADRIGRGWRLPTQLAAGDVLEVGADTTDRPVRWYGIIVAYDPDQSLTVQGPYPHPAAAHRHADQLLDAQRFQPALETKPPQPATPAERAAPQPRRRHRHRHH